MCTVEWLQFCSYTICVAHLDNLDKTCALLTSYKLVAEWALRSWSYGRVYQTLYTTIGGLIDIGSEMVKIWILDFEKKFWPKL